MYETICYSSLATQFSAGDKVLAWLEFVVWAAVIIVAGIKLTRYGDVFTEKFHLSHGFIGFIFIGWATSLPEFVITITCVTGLDQPNPDYSIGNIFGSCFFNIFIIGVMGAVFLVGPLFAKVSRNLILAAVLSMIMIMTAILGLVAPGVYGDYDYLWDPFGGLGYHVSLFSIILLGMYASFGYIVFRHDRKVESLDSKDVKAQAEPTQYGDWSTGWTVFKAAAAAGAIVFAGVMLTFTGDKLQKLHNLDASIIGTLFLAIVSSLPELVTALAAARLFLYDMAIGSIFGSNIFNLMILAVADFLYKDEVIYASASGKHKITGIFVIILSCICICGMIYRSKRKIARIGIDVIAIVVVYILGAILVFFMKGD
ncbi:MAG: sodium:calcium antiporter [Planctomycetota bacterium]|jgi:cation:H+ antiporter